MSWAEHLRAKIAYNEWANNKVFTAASALSDEQLSAERTGTSGGALANDLEHLVGVQEWWHSVAADTGYVQRESAASTGVIAELQRRLAESNAALRALAGSLTNETLEGEIERSRGDQTWRWKQWQVIEHLLNHSAHHRAEIGQVLHSLDASPGDLDFIYFLNE